MLGIGLCYRRFVDQGWRISCWLDGEARVAASFGEGEVLFIVVLEPQLMVRLGADWDLPRWHQTLLLLGLTTMLWFSVVPMTRQDPVSVLADFYRRVWVAL